MHIESLVALSYGRNSKATAHKDWLSESCGARPHKFVCYLFLLKPNSNRIHGKLAMETCMLECNLVAKPTLCLAGVHSKRAGNDIPYTKGTGGQHVGDG